MEKKQCDHVNKINDLEIVCRDCGMVLGKILREPEDTDKHNEILHELNFRVYKRMVHHVNKETNEITRIHNYIREVFQIFELDKRYLPHARYLALKQIKTEKKQDKKNVRFKIIVNASVFIILKAFNRIHSTQDFINKINEQYENGIMINDKKTYKDKNKIKKKIHKLNTFRTKVQEIIQNVPKYNTTHFREFDCLLTILTDLNITDDDIIKDCQDLLFKIKNNSFNAFEPKSIASVVIYNVLKKHQDQKITLAKTSRITNVCQKTIYNITKILEEKKVIIP